MLIKTQIVSSSNLLTSLTNSGKQVFIDAAIQAWNEAVDQVYSKSKIMKPEQGSEDSITLVEGERYYDLPCDLVQIHWPLHDVTNGLYIQKYPGGFEELRNAQTQPANYTGQPSEASISPIDGTLYINRTPTDGEDGYVYEYFYWKDTGLSSANDVFPFSDVVFRAMVPVVAELWRYNQNNRYTSGIADVNYGRAIRALKQEPRDTPWIKRPGGVPYTNPLGFSPFSDA